MWNQFADGGSSGPNCSTDYAVFPNNATPVVGGAANIVIFNNLYSGGTVGNPGLCGTGGPTVMAAYAVGTTPLNGSNLVFSYEGPSKGQKFAILERQKALLHVVTVGTGGSVDNAIAPTEVTIDYTNVTNAHCNAGTVHTANHSDVWVAYNTDKAYVGDDDGKLYQIGGIFNGTPTVDFCNMIDSGAYIQLPLAFASNSIQYVFVPANGRRLYRVRVNSAGTAFTGATNLLLSNIQGGLPAYPLSMDVDSGNGYVRTNHDTTGTNSALYQISLLTTPMAILSELSLGEAETPSSGTLHGQYGWQMFDNTFSTQGAGATGATGYTCVYPNGSSGAPALASFQFNSSGVMNSTFTAMDNNTNMNPTGATTGNVCTALLESYDPVAGVDQLFVGTGNGTATNANEVSRWDITTPLTSNSDEPTASVTNIPGGPSAIYLDFISSGLGDQTQNVYMMNLATPTSSRCGGTSPNFNDCAVKLQQAGLN